MPILTGSQTGQLSEALRKTFVSVDSFQEFLLVMLDESLEQYTSLRLGYQSVMFNLIRVLDAEDRVPELVSAACAARPRNGALRKLAVEIGLSAMPASEQDALAGTQLERTILESVGFLEASTWHARLGDLMAQVCRIEVPAGTRSRAGTGFLVGPNLVLTNYHVIDALHTNMGNPADTVLRFDLQRLPSGITVNKGTEFHLSTNWLVAWQPASKVDNLANPGDQVPCPNELDFALLRVDGNPGSQPLGKAAGLLGAPTRGWMQLEQSGQNCYGDGYPLFILQHPDDGPLKLAPGQSGGMNANQTRLRHLVNTERGSSGSPCLNARLELVAVHHAGDPNYDPSHKQSWNAAVPISQIRAALAGISR